MFVRDMRPDQAMFFVYEPPQHVAMWMKNTLLPLDMLFVDEAGCVAKTVRDARPGSLDTIWRRMADRARRRVEGRHDESARHRGR